ncbi:MAG: 3-dehydroquinate synthase [Fibrobacteria bacterium]|nr:3-dehydroquinate synthase [Fibrobacteria bacterium]
MTHTQKKSDIFESTHQVHNQQFTVSFDYPVYFTRNLFNKEHSLLEKVITRKNGNLPHRVMAYVDSRVAQKTPDLIPAIVEYFRFRSNKLDLVQVPQVIEGGESAKNGWGDVRKIISAIGDSHLDRQSFILAIGGGSLLDMVGFACSLVHRGIRIIRIPTTVLSQNDAGVGVKNGMNEREIKNFLGTFAPPFAVIDDYDFLGTLEHKDWVGGIAEAFKVAIIKDPEFFSFLCEHAEALNSQDASLMETLIHRCAVIHLDHISGSGDPFEFGSSRPLDFGHWSAHTLEALSSFTLGHGQAVAIGIALDSFYACKKGMLTKEELNSILTGLETSGLPVYSPFLSNENTDGKLKILEGLEQFREHLGGRLTLAMPNSIGKQCEINDMDINIVKDGVTFLKERAGLKKNNE